MRPLISFALAFIIGAILALAVRAALHQPHAGHEPSAAAGGDYKPMVSNASTPAAQHDTQHADHGKAAAPKTDATKPSTPADHSAHHHGAASDKPVNTICAICGMEVDPDLPTATYQGQTIGFGCAACPPKFRANPDRYGPAYLRNERAK